MFTGLPVMNRASSHACGLPCCSRAAWPLVPRRADVQPHRAAVAARCR